MKEITIIIIAFLIVVTGSNISKNYLEKTSNDLQNDIKILKDEVKKAQNSENNNANQVANDIYNKWKENEKVWSLIVIHDELDNIELSLIGMKSLIEENEFEEGIEELEKSEFLLEHIKEKEKLNLKNLF